MPDENDEVQKENEQRAETKWERMVSPMDSKETQSRFCGLAARR